ncbi:hypothetical protein IWQ57_004817, partial [Coemansia nantahalensis]
LRRRSAYIPPELFAANVLLIHGKRDSTFVLQQSQRLFRELCEIDVPEVNMKIYANLRRVDPSIALLAPASALAQSLLEDIRSSVSPPADRAPEPRRVRHRGSPKHGGASGGAGAGAGSDNDAAAPQGHGTAAPPADSSTSTAAGADTDTDADAPSEKHSHPYTPQGATPGLFARRRPKSLLATIA